MLDGLYESNLKIELAIQHLIFFSVHSILFSLHFFFFFFIIVWVLSDDIKILDLVNGDKDREWVRER